MKRTTSSIVLALLVATGAAGCGSENPMGPSFARTAPAVETAGAMMTISPEPVTIDNGDGMDTQELDAVDARTGRKAKKAKKPNLGQANGHE
ncbi:MAG: hypothetical protein ABIP29_04330 [Candidatus Eisenbacteria bacterium]